MLLCMVCKKMNESCHVFTELLWYLWYLSPKQHEINSFDIYPWHKQSVYGTCHEIILPTTWKKIPSGWVTPEIILSNDLKTPQKWCLAFLGPTPAPHTHWMDSPCNNCDIWAVLIACRKLHCHSGWTSLVTIVLSQWTNMHQVMDSSSDTCTEWCCLLLEIPTSLWQWPVWVMVVCSASGHTNVQWSCWLVERQNTSSFQVWMSSQVLTGYVWERQIGEVTEQLTNTVCQGRQLSHH